MKVYEIITNEIIAKLEAGTVPWHRPWQGGEWPKNLVSKKEYRGVNTFMLSCSGFTSPYWATYKQVSELGGQIIKGSIGTPIVFWKWLDKDVEDSDGDTFQKKVPLMRFYKVFNLEQTTGIDPKKLPVVEIKKKINNIKACENVINNMPNKPEIVHVEARAYYRPSTDTVNMPNKNTFDTAEHYYATMFHELTHSTGAAKRLNRTGVAGSDGFGSEKYSKEELVAEMGAAFLCGFCGIENVVLDNSAAYIDNWLGRLQKDKQLVIQAASMAQKACDYILKKEFEG